MKYNVQVYFINNPQPLEWTAIEWKVVKAIVNDLTTQGLAPLVQQVTITLSR